MTRAIDRRPLVEDDGEHRDHRREIEQVVADVEAGVNGNDPELSVEHFIENARVINARGVRLSGGDASVLTWRSR